MTQLLYHYTSLDTFLKIGEHQSIRLSDLSQSNDALEGRYIESQLLDEIGRSSIPERYIRTVQNIVSQAVKYERRFGFCLTTEHDDLSQWRGYGDDGFGVCIGFERDLTLSAVQNTNKATESAILQEVFYGPEPLSKTVETVVGKLEEKLSGLDPTIINANFVRDQNLGIGPSLSIEGDLEYDKVLVMKLALEALEEPLGLAFNFKTDAFRAENEWRILVSCGPHRDPIEAKYTSKRNRISAYLEADISGSISQVTIGPKSDVTVNDLERVLFRLGLRDIFDQGVKVKKSAASYR